MGGYRKRRRSTSTVRKNAFGEKEGDRDSSNNRRCDDQEWDIRPDGEAVVRRKHAVNRFVGWYQCRHSVPRAKDGELAGIRSRIVSRASPTSLKSDSPETFIPSSISRRRVRQSSKSLVAPPLS